MQAVLVRVPSFLLRSLLSAWIAMRGCSLLYGLYPTLCVSDADGVVESFSLEGDIFHQLALSSGNRLRGAPVPLLPFVNTAIR